MEEIDKVWLACAIDCEGTIGMLIRSETLKKKPNLPRSSPSMYIGIANTSYPLIYRAAELLDTGIAKPYSRGNSKPVYVTKLARNDDVCNILTEVKDYLIVKKEQAELAILFCKMKKTSTKEQLLSSETYKIITGRISLLNKRGKV